MAFSKCMNTLSSRNNPPVMEPTNKVDNLTPGIFNSIQTVILVDEFSHLQIQQPSNQQFLHSNHGHYSRYLNIYLSSQYFCIDILFREYMTKNQMPPINFFLSEAHRT